MTPTQVKILLDSGVLQAYAEGKEIQFIDPRIMSSWISLEVASTPDFTPEYLQWRVKPEKKTGWINIYSGSFQDWNMVHPSKEDASSNQNRNKNRLACIQITYEEGEGL